MSSQANKEQFLKQFEQIVEGVKQNKNKVKLQTWIFLPRRNIVNKTKRYVIPYLRATL